jgi:hypothetical protein
VQKEDDSEMLNYLADEAVDYLNSLDAPDYCSFTADDNSLFFAPCVESARYDVGFVTGQDGQDYPDDDYEGTWLDVSDHGNATLYLRKDGKDEYLWSVV